MIAFVKGSVYGTTNVALILETHGIGYQIFTPDPKQYAIGSEVLLYTYQNLREDALAVYVFKENETYERI